MPIIYSTSSPEPASPLVKGDAGSGYESARSPIVSLCRMRVVEDK